MPETKDTTPLNPTAFPTDMQTQGGGMTLRDYFAAAVLPAVYAALDRDNAQSEIVDPCSASLAAYDVADAMLAERAKGGC